MQNKTTRTQLRIPTPLYERIRERAHEERKSRNSAMVEALEREFPEAKERGAA